MKKIIDCFIFFNEIDLLEIRLKYLYDTVDYFVIVESDTTFSGNTKVFYFEENIKRFEKFKDKIRYIPIKMKPLEETKDVAWDRERYQRNYIYEALKKLPLKNEAFILISDTDEIPNKETLKKLKNNNLTEVKTKNNLLLTINTIIYALKQLEYKIKAKHKDKYLLRLKFMYYILIKKYNRPITFQMDDNLFFLNYSRSKKTMFGLQCIDLNWLKLFTIEDIRNFKKTPVSHVKSGWHFTYLGGKEMIKNKIKNFSHQEFNHPKILSDDYIDVLHRLTHLALF